MTTKLINLKKKTIEKNNYKVMVVDSGMDALNYFETEKFDVIRYKYAFDEWFETTKRIRQKV
jgi:DNA-binding response OmpR family regulator